MTFKCSCSEILKQKNKADISGMAQEHTFYGSLEFIVDLPITYPWALLMQTHKQDMGAYVRASKLSGYKTGCKHKCIHSPNVTKCVQLFSLKVFI